MTEKWCEIQGKLALKFELTGCSSCPSLSWEPSTGLDEQNKNFAPASRFFYISLPSLHDFHVRLPIFTFYGGLEQKTTTLFFFLNLDFIFAVTETNFWTDKNLHRLIMIRLSFTANPRNRAYFWTAKRNAICNINRKVPCKRVAPDGLHR